MPRYYLYHRKDTYYIISSHRFGIIAQAIAQACTPIASVTAYNSSIAYRHLITVALFHSLMQ